ncbi:MAG TPA: peptidoglycan-binding protein [Stellaceae bacterium]|nr:peptidoglycan-binding protein [Stellaceae bacterium]
MGTCSGKLFLLLTLLSGVSMLSACNTMAGAGQDMQHAGRAITNSADANKSDGQSAQRQQTEIMQAQNKLNAEGLYKGKIDGIDGPKTHQALLLFQDKYGLQQTGQLDRQTEQRLGLNTTGVATQGYGSSVPPAATVNDENTAQ